MSSTYSIRDLERISGIKAHTLRIWEQRHNILSPKRTETNIRYYDSNDLKLLLSIRMLNNNGVRISKIAKMGEDEIHQEVSKLWESSDEFESQIDALVVTMIELDEERFEKIINRNIVQIGLENTMKEVIYPFYHKVGLMWQTCAISPAQEHFISNLIRQKVIVAIDGQLTAPRDAKKFMLFLPDGELHEIGLLFANYIIRARDQRTIYLGQSLPLSNLESVTDQYDPDYLFTMFTSGWSKIRLEEYLKEIATHFPNTPILTTGPNIIIEDPEIPSTVTILKSIDELVDLLEKA